MGSDPLSPLERVCIVYVQRLRQQYAIHTCLRLPCTTAGLNLVVTVDSSGAMNGADRN